MQEEEDCQPQLPRHSLVRDGRRTQDLPKMCAICRVRVNYDRLGRTSIEPVRKMWINERQKGDTWQHDKDCDIFFVSATSLTPSWSSTSWGRAVYTWCLCPAILKRWVTRVLRGSTLISIKLYYHRITNKLYIYFDIDIYLFTYCNWVSTQWQRSVDLYRNNKEIAVYKRRNNAQNTKTIQKHRIQKIEKECTK
jgi:hypothetical protein